MKIEFYKTLIDFLAFLVVWIVSISLIEYNPENYWLDMITTVVGGLILFFWGRITYIINQS